MPRKSRFIISSFSNPLTINYARLLRVVDEGKDHAVKVVEEAEKVKAELDEALLLVLTQRTENLCCVKHVLSVHDLVGVVGDEWQVPSGGDPLSTDQVDEGHERLYKHLGKNELIQLVAEFDRVNIIDLEITDEDDEENLDEQETSADDDAEEKNHSLSRHYE